MSGGIVTYAPKLWEWVLAPAGKCYGCNVLLKGQGPVVRYAAHDWHVHCVLDKLPTPGGSTSCYGPYDGS